MVSVEALAARPEILRETKPGNRVTALFRRVLGRSPAKNEITSALQFIDDANYDEQTETSLTPWEQFAQVLLISNEAIFVD